MIVSWRIGDPMKQKISVEPDVHEHENKNCLSVAIMSVGRIFCRVGGTRGFFQNFPGGTNVVKFVFSHSKLKNNLY